MSGALRRRLSLVAIIGVVLGQCAACFVPMALLAPSDPVRVRLVIGALACALWFALNVPVASACRRLRDWGVW